MLSKESFKLSKNIRDTNKTDIMVVKDEFLCQVGYSKCCIFNFIMLQMLIFIWKDHEWNGIKVLHALSTKN